MRKLLVFLFIANALAVGYLAWTRSRPTVKVQPPVDSTHDAAAVPTLRTATSAPPVIQTNIANTFEWAALETNDYREYIRRLRAIGCPEQTIRDLVIADIDKTFAARVAAIYPRRQELNFWQSEDAELANNYDQREFARKQKEIEREKQRVIRELLGVDLAGERLRLQGQEDRIERRLSFLPEEKRYQIRQWLEDWEDQEWSVREQALDGHGGLSEQDKARLRELNLRKEQALSKLLTPEERERFDLWMSPTAETIRHDMYGMDPTEQEFRAVYDLRREFEQVWPRDEIDPNNEQHLEAWGRALLDLEDKIKAALGEERFTMYQRGEDPRFHDLNATVSRYRLSRDKAAEAYEYLRIFQLEHSRMMSNPGLSPAQQQELSRLMQAETDAALRSLMGEPAFNHFQRLGNQVKR